MFLNNVNKVGGSIAKFTTPSPIDCFVLKSFAISKLVKAPMIGSFTQVLAVLMEVISSGWMVMDIIRPAHLLFLSIFSFSARFFASCLSVSAFSISSRCFSASSLLIDTTDGKKFHHYCHYYCFASSDPPALPPRRFREFLPLPILPRCMHIFVPISVPPQGLADLVRPSSLCSGMNRRDLSSTVCPHPSPQLLHV